MKKKGGRLLEEGADGCVFKPALKCKGKTRRAQNTVSKLMFKNEAEVEYKAKSQLQSINSDRKYFIYPQEICKMNTDLFDPYIDDIEMCSKPFNYGNMNTPDRPKIIDYPYGGNDIESIKKLHPSEYISFFDGFANIFSAVEKLHKNNLVHLDIRPHNIVALKKEDGAFNMRMIDFGFLTKVDDKKKIFYLSLFNDYYIWPYDIKFAAIIARKRGVLRNTYEPFSKNDITDDSLDHFKEVSVGQLHNRIPLVLFKILINLDVNYYKEIYDNINTNNDLNQKLDLILKGADVYSLGLTLAELYRRYIKHIMVETAEGDDYEYDLEGRNVRHLSTTAAEWHRDVTENITVPLTKLTVLMMAPNPEERPSITEAKNQYNAILLNMHKYFTEDKITVGLEHLFYLPVSPIAPYVPNAISAEREAARREAEERNPPTRGWKTTLPVEKPYTRPFLKMYNTPEINASESPMGGKYRNNKKQNKTRKIRK